MNLQIIPLGALQFEKKEKKNHNCYQRLVAHFDSFSKGNTIFIHCVQIVEPSFDERDHHFQDRSVQKGQKGNHPFVMFLLIS